MESLKLRNKLIEQFNTVIQDDAKLAILDGVFDSMTAAEHSYIIPEQHYNLVEERRNKWLEKKACGRSWEEVKKQLKQKYDL